MANLGYKRDDDKLHTISDVTTGGDTTIRTQDVPMPKFDLSVDGHGDAFKDRLEAMRGAAEHNSAEPGLRIDAVAMDVGLIKSSLDAGLSAAHALVREAKALIKDEKYDAAATKLREALDQEPRNEEAQCLLGYCLFKTGQILDAFRLLASARAVAMDAGIRRRMDAVFLDIRQHLSTQTLLEHVIWAATDHLGGAAEHMRELVNLDPECPLFWFLFVGDLWKAGKLAEAMEEGRRAATIGSRSEQAQMRQLTEAIQNDLAIQQLAPVKRAYRSGDYRAALRHLSGLNKAIRSTGLCVTLDKYLHQLVGVRVLGVFGRGERDPQTVHPAGSQEEVDTMYRYLVSEELEQAVKQFRDDQFRRARQVVDKGLALAPHFAFLHFLYGAATLRQVMAGFEKGSPPKLDRAIADMTEASHHAEFGSTDSKNREAPALVKAVGHVLRQLKQAEAHLSARRAEARVVNKAIEEFKSIMGAVGDGIVSAEHLADIHSRMKALSKRLPKARRQAKSPEAVEAVSRLSEAVERHLIRLAESGPITEAMAEFKSIMDAVGDGIDSAKHLADIHSRMGALSDRLPSLRRAASSAGAVEAVSQLSDAVEKHLRALDDAKKQTGESQKVNELVSQFNAATEMVSKSDGIRSREQLEGIRTIMSCIQDGVRDAKRTVKAPAGQKVLADLEKAVENVLDQIRYL